MEAMTVKFGFYAHRNSDFETTWIEPGAEIEYADVMIEDGTRFVFFAVNGTEYSVLDPKGTYESAMMKYTAFSEAA